MKTKTWGVKRLVLAGALVAALGIGLGSTASANGGCYRGYGYGYSGGYAPRPYGQSGYYSSYGARYRSWNGYQNYGYGGSHYGGYHRPHRGYSYGYSY